MCAHRTAATPQGYGPEMYVLRDAPRGHYDIRAHYCASDRNRASARTKVHEVREGHREGRYARDRQGVARDRHARALTVNRWLFRRAAKPIAQRWAGAAIARVRGYRGA